MLGAGFKTSLFQGRKEAYSVYEFARIYDTGGLASLVSKEPLVKLLDSDMSVDDFKVAWTQHALKKQADKDKPADELKHKKPKSIQVVSKNETHKHKAASEYRKFYEFVAREFNDGKNVFKILKSVDMSV